MVFPQIKAFCDPFSDLLADGTTFVTCGVGGARSGILTAPIPIVCDISVTPVGQIAYPPGAPITPRPSCPCFRFSVAPSSSGIERRRKGRLCLCERAVSQCLATASGRGVCSRRIRGSEAWNPVTAARSRLLGRKRQKSTEGSRRPCACIETRPSRSKAKAAPVRADPAAEKRSGLGARKHAVANNCRG